MPTPDPGALFPLPKVVNAPRICVTMQIPGDIESISNFVGALSRLMLWNNYRRDDNKTGRLVAQIWKEIVQNIEFTDCDRKESGTGCGEDDCMGCCLRFNSDGILECFSCGEWHAVEGAEAFTALIKGTSQPPGGGALSEGQCLDYDVTLFASNQYLLPVAVSEGDVITVSLAQGGWSDGDVIGPFGAAWSCPNGSVYALGTCGATNPTDSGDPAPSLPHMRLIANINGTFVDGFNQTIVVPPGNTDVPVAFQANDVTLADNAGSITFHVNVCRQTTPMVITYSSGLGIGPSTAQVGDIITITGELYGPSGRYVGYPVFSKDVKIQVLTPTGYTPDGASNATYWTWVAGGVFGSCNALQPCDGSDPTVFDQTLAISEYQLISSTAFTMYLKILAIA